MDAENLDDLILTYHKCAAFLEQAEHEALKICRRLIAHREFLGLVTSRVKDARSLRSKLKKKEALGVQFRTIQDVWSKVRDLVGIRISLYSEGHLDEVQQFIYEEFLVHETKVYGGSGAVDIIGGPDTTSDLSLNTNTTTRTTCAEERPHLNGHREDQFGRFRGRIFKVSLKARDTGFISDCIEIQVVSIYTQIWADIAHGIIYKQYTGRPSPEELTAIKAMYTQSLVLHDMSATFFRHHKARLEFDAQPFESQESLIQFLESVIPHAIWAEEPSRESPRSLDALEGLLDALGKNSRRELTKVLEGIALTYGSYKSVAVKYHPMSLSPSLWIIDCLLSTLSEQEWGSRRQVVVGQQDLNTYRLRVVESSILWAYELFSDCKGELLGPDFAEDDLAQDEIESIMRVFQEPSRTSIIKGEITSDMNGHTQILWDWLAKLTRKPAGGAAFDLAFRMSQLGVFQSSEECVNLSRIPRLYRMQNNVPPPL